MIEHPIIVFTCFFILLYGIFSKIAEKSIITAPMIFISVGVLASCLHFPELQNGIHGSWVKLVTEITLVLVLFNDATSINLQALKRDRSIPIRLLFIGLPLTMVFGLIVAVFLFNEQDTILLALMAFILSPTDAALGLAVVKSEYVPLKIRQSINVESGLNDGIALPPILICLAFLNSEISAHSEVSNWAWFIFKQFILGPLIGGAVGYFGGKLVEKASQKMWMNHTFQSLSSISIAILAFSLAEAFHGNGFIAAFFAGMLLGTKEPGIRNRIIEFGEAQSQVLILFIFLLFGLILVPISFPYWSGLALFYALLSLTIIRMLPISISLIGTNLGWKSSLFIAWFGPRGIASILYLLMAYLQLNLNADNPIVSVIVLTVLLSVFLHGISAIPFSNLVFKKN